MKTATCILLSLPLAATAQINYSGGLYTQDFDSLKDDVIFQNATNLPSGWVVSHGSYVWTDGTNGYSNNYGTFCFASGPGALDKALGLVIGTTGPASFGARFRNTTGIVLNSFTLRYFVEQWVKGAVNAQDQNIPFQYSLTATSLTTGTYTNFTALDMHSINDGNGIFSALNGNAATNRQQVTGTVTGITWATNQDLWIRWVGVSYSIFASHALAVDDLSFFAVPELQVAQPASGTLSFTWPTNASNYILQSVTTLSTSNWNAVTNIPVVSSNQFRVDINTSNTGQFFRLITQ